jgi:regulatory protein YycI of two-component signal transduction system YycFG
MKNIKIQHVIIIISIVCCTFLTVSYLNYKNDKLQIEKSNKLKSEAVKSGMVQVPVDICLNATQELRWVRPSDYLRDIPIITPGDKKK